MQKNCLRYSCKKELACLSTPVGARSKSQSRRKGLGRLGTPAWIGRLGVLSFRWFSSDFVVFFGDLGDVHVILVGTSRQPVHCPRFDETCLVSQNFMLRFVVSWRFAWIFVHWTSVFNESVCVLRCALPGVDSLRSFRWCYPGSLHVARELKVGVPQLPAQTDRFTSFQGWQRLAVSKIFEFPQWEIYQTSIIKKGGAPV